MDKQYLHLTTEDKPIYVLGDLHCDLESLKGYFTNHALSECNFIIAGDIGLGFYPRSVHLRELTEFNNFLKERNILLYLFRGNHDNPKYFNREIREDDEFMFSNIKVLPDYSVLTTNGYNILMVGGAISIDRTHRLFKDIQRLKELKAFYPLMDNEKAREAIQPTYWEDEFPVFNQEILNAINNDGIKISYVITHSSPTFVFPHSKNGLKEWMKIDKELEKDNKQEREVMDKIYNFLIENEHPLKEWVYGHYHTHHQELIDDNILFTTLFNLDKTFDTHEIAQKYSEEDIY